MEAPVKQEQSTRFTDLEAKVESMEKALARKDEKSNMVSIVCFSCEWDKLFAALTIANGALALGQEVHLFFTFWASAALRDATKKCPNKSFVDRIMGRFLPCGARNAPLSRMNWGGLGKIFLGHRMKKHNIEGIDVMMERAEEMGAHFHLCDMSASLLGLECDELVGDGCVDPCGVAAFLSKAMKGNMVLFI